MKRKFLTFYLILCSSFAMCRENPVKISLNGGPCYHFDIEQAISNYYPDAQTGISAGFDLTHYFGNKMFVAGHYNFQTFNYFDPHSPSDEEISTRSDGSNTQVYKMFAGLTLGYHHLFFDRIDLSGSIGFAVIGVGEEQNRNYTLLINKDGYSYESYKYYIYETFTGDLAFPIRIGAEYVFNGGLTAGILAGFYYQPDVIIMGLHWGPTIGYQF